MIEPLYIALVNGIRTWPGDDRNWTQKGVTWLHNYAFDHPEIRLMAECVEYRTLALTRWGKHREWVHKFGKNLDKHRKWKRVRIAAHSNGANIVLDALREKGWPEIEHLHLISPACERDISYLEPQLGTTIKKLTIWIAGRDIPLQIVRWSGIIAQRLLGYGDLGFRGPVQNMSPEAMRHIRLIRKSDFGHGTWFTDRYINQTMREIVAGNALTP